MSSQTEMGHSGTAFEVEFTSLEITHARQLAARYATDAAVFEDRLG